MIGRVKVFFGSRDRQFGFIDLEADGEPVETFFFHRHQLEPDSALPQQGDIVEFEIAD
jgi:cold shock CspA family protein